MKLFKEHGGVVAVVLSVLAVVVASGGTAVAVSSTVSIADPTTPSRVAKVDASGRLSTGGALAVINSTGYLSGFQNMTTTQATSATTATLAISRIQLSDPTANAGGAEQQIALSKYPVDTSGACTTTTLPVLVARYNVEPGDDLDDALPAPIVVRPTGAAKYCLFWHVEYLSSDPAPSFYLQYGVTAYVVTGVYTGIGDGTSAPSAKAPASARTGG